MEAAAADPGLSETDRFHIHFALGRALEQRKAYAPSFHHYAEGNRLRHDQIGYDPADIRRLVARSKALFTRSFYEERQDHGSNAADPIFILGMPRAGSTLIEQILASHSAIEGTMELPDIPALAKELGAGRAAPATEAYPNPLFRLSADESRRIGESYLARTRVQRKTDRPHFIDKLPNNWINIGFIHLILPNAKIIDARRHPLDCCFSNFKQHYARGQAFSYDLADVGHYYADYVDLLGHFDAVLPGRIHRVIHERLIEDPAGEVRRLLDYLRLPFEDACLASHETRRAIRTPSSEQVRKPINKDGMDQWRPYEPWLAPLKEALGPVLTAYPAVPDLRGSGI
jgi:Sulfotransferase family